LLTSTGIQAVNDAHEDFLVYCERAGIAPPVNRGGTDLFLRGLDCAVINHLHEIRKEAKFQPFDTVRAVFVEGGRIYTESGFLKRRISRSA
jgi:hypothetical protein